MIVFHYNDGKETSQSHEVWNDQFEDKFMTGIHGYGKDFLDALQDYEDKLLKYFDDMKQFINDNHIDEVIKVDFLGNPLKKE